MLHAGGKFDGKAYAVSGGLHGVGVSVVNALSTRMDVEIHKAGFVWRQHYTDSKPGPLEKGEPTDRTGSAVTFWPDPKIFETVDFDFQTIYRRLQEMAFLNRGLTIHAARRAGRREEDGKPREVTFYYEGGIADFVRHLNRPKNPIHKTVIEFGAEGRGRHVRSRSPCSGTSRTASRSTPSPTRSTRTRAAPTRRASGPR